MYDMSVCVQEFGQASLYTDSSLFLYTGFTTSLCLIQCLVHILVNSIPAAFSACDSMIPSVICSVGFLIPLFIFLLPGFFLSIPLIELLSFSQTSVQFLCSVQAVPDRHELYIKIKKFHWKKRMEFKGLESCLQRSHTHT